MSTINFSTIEFGQSFLPIDPAEWNPSPFAPPSSSDATSPSPPALSFPSQSPILHTSIAVTCSNVKRPPEQDLERPKKISKKDKVSKTPTVAIKYYKYEELINRTDQWFARLTGVTKERFEQLANILRENSHKKSAHGSPQMLWTTILNIKYKIALKQIIKHTQNACERTLQNYIKHTWVCLSQEELKELGCKVASDDSKFLRTIQKNKRNGTLVSPFRRPIEEPAQNP